MVAGLIRGPLMGGPQCRLSILRNGNVPCRYFLNVPVEFKIVQCRLSILKTPNVAFQLKKMAMSPVTNFEKSLSILR